MARWSVSFVAFKAAVSWYPDEDNVVLRVSEKIPDVSDMNILASRGVQLQRCD